MDAKEQARALVSEAVQELAEKGKDGSIPGPVIGYLIKKGKIDAPKGGKKQAAPKAGKKEPKKGGKRKRKVNWAAAMASFTSGDRPQAGPSSW